MIKGRYVCQVEVDFEYEREEKLEAFMYSEMHDRMMNGTWCENAIHDKVKEVFAGGCSQVKVSRQYADITRMV